MEVAACAPLEIRAGLQEEKKERGKRVRKDARVMPADERKICFVTPHGIVLDNYVRKLLPRTRFISFVFYSKPEYTDILFFAYATDFFVVRQVAR